MSRRLEYFFTETQIIVTDRDPVLQLQGKPLGEEMSVSSGKHTRVLQVAKIPELGRISSTGWSIAVAGGYNEQTILL